MRDNEIKSHVTPPYQNAIIAKIPQLIEEFKELLGECDWCFDLNDAIRHSKESLFTNHWIHTNARGNKICSEYILQKIKKLL